MVLYYDSPEKLTQQPTERGGVVLMFWKLALRKFDCLAPETTAGGQVKFVGQSYAQSHAAGLCGFYHPPSF